MDSNENLEALLEGIRREAREERERVLAEARAEARRILEEADARVAELEGETRRRAELRLKQGQERQRAVARLSESASRLRAARASISRAFELAAEKVRARCGSSEYPRAVKTLIRQALETVPGKVQVGVIGKDADIAREALSEAGREGEVAPVAGSAGTAIVTSSDGMRSVDNSLSVRLSVAADTLEREVFLTLGGADSSP